MKLLHTLALLLLSAVAFSQDLLVFQDGTEVKGKLTEVNVDDVKYTRPDMPGTTFTALKAELEYVLYANGSKLSFSGFKARAPERREEVRQPRRDDRRMTEANYKRKMITHIVFGTAMVGVGSAVALSTLVKSSALYGYPPFAIAGGLVAVGGLAIGATGAVPGIKWKKLRDKRLAGEAYFSPVLSPNHVGAGLALRF